MKLEDFLRNPRFGNAENEFKFIQKHGPATVVADNAHTSLEFILGRRAADEAMSQETGQARSVERTESCSHLRGKGVRRIFGIHTPVVS